MLQVRKSKFGPLFLQSGFSDAIFNHMRGVLLVNFALWISLWIFCPSFEGREGPKKSTEKKSHTKNFNDQSHALRIKFITTNALQMLQVRKVAVSKFPDFLLSFVPNFAANLPESITLPRKESGKGSLGKRSLAKR